MPSVVARRPARRRVPTMPIGAPMMQSAVQTPDVNAPEPVNLVGDSGKTYARMGEAGREAISVTPMGGARMPVPSASGGAPDFLQAGFDYRGPASAMGLQEDAWADVRDVYNGREPSPYGAWDREQAQAWLESHGFGRMMALGGYAVVGGGGGYNPTSTALMRNRRRRDQLSQVYGARRNVQDLQNVGMQRTLQASQDYKYGMAGVAQPQGIDLPEGFQGQLSPLVRPNIRTQADRLQSRFSEENAFADLDDEYARLSAGQNQGGGYRVAPSPATRNVGGMNPGGAPFVGVPFGTPDTSEGPAGHVRYTDPNGNTRWLRPGDAAIAKARDQMQLEERAQKELAKAPSPEEMQAQQEKQHEARMKREGYVLYRDPVTRQPEWLSPFDAAIRKSADEEKLEAATKKVKPREAFEKVSPARLLQGMVDGDLDFDEGYAALAAQGYSREEIDFLVRTTKKTEDDDLGRGKEVR